MLKLTTVVYGWYNTNMKNGAVIIGIVITLLAGSIYGIYNLQDNGDMFTDIATFHDDIQYCQSSHPRQQMDIHVPSSATEAAPAPYVFYVHGGGWKEGSMRNNIDDYYPRFLINQGIAFVTVDYRLVPEATYPEQNNDIACAYTYLQKNGGKYNLDTDRVGIMGDSAGGQLASMEAFRSSPAGDIKALATFYGVSDLWYQITENNSKTAIAYLGGNPTEELAKKASPYYAPIEQAVPTLFIHGTADTLVTFENSKRQYDRLQKASVDSTLLTVEGAGHGFGDNKGSKAQAEVEPILTKFFTERLRATN